MNRKEAWKGDPHFSETRGACWQVLVMNEPKERKRKEEK
jgi:hypothetical protein